MSNSKSKNKRRPTSQKGAAQGATQAKAAATDEAAKASDTAARSVSKDADKAASAAKGVDASKAVKKADSRKTDTKKVDAKKADAKKAEAKKKANKKPNVFKRLMQYFHDVQSELKRVTWPTKHEIWHSSLVVVGALVFFGLLIFAIDSAVVPLLTLYSGLA